MKVIINNDPKPTRNVGSMKPNEAFKLSDSWYIRIEMDDGCIENYSCFWSMHAETIPGYHEPRDEYGAVPCFRLSSSSFVYLDPDLEVINYGVPTLSVDLS